MFLLSSSHLAEEWDFSKAGRVTNCGGTCIIVKEEGKDGEKVIPVTAEGLVARTHCWWIPLLGPQGQQWGSRRDEGGKEVAHPQRSYVELIPENLVAWRG